MIIPGFCRTFGLLLLLSFSTATNPLAAQTPTQNFPPGPADQSNEGSPPDLEAVPNRPTFSSIAETVATGVFEIEYGVDLAHGYQDINGLNKFGLLKNFEIRFGNYPVERSTGVTGIGDSSAGFKYRFLKQKGSLPTLSVLYALTIPTAMAKLGSGAAGHSAGLLVSKDFKKHHLDFNESIQWLGRPGSDGFDHNYFTALAYSHPITSKFGFSEEVAGYSRTNAAVGGTLTVLQALTYAPSSRLVFDAGCYIAAIGDLPRIVFVGGVTYSVGNLYRVLHRSH